MPATILRFMEFRNSGADRIRSRDHHSFVLVLRLASGLLGSALCTFAQVNGVGEKPYLGWSSFSQQTISSNFLTQANITAQSDALLASGLQSHGFNYINMDSGWMGAFDNYGALFPTQQRFQTSKRWWTTSTPMARRPEFTGFPA